MLVFAQVADSITATYQKYFEPGAERASIPDIVPNTSSFKIVAEIPMQRKSSKRIKFADSVHVLLVAHDMCCAVMFLINLYSRSMNAYIQPLAQQLANVVSLPGDLPDDVKQSLYRQLV
jgi:hypothetical protein